MKYRHQLKALPLLQAFEKSINWALLTYYDFTMIQTCTCLFSSN